MPLAPREARIPEEENLRATLTQEVIAGAPILDRAEITARVDEIMGMAIADEGPANSNANDVQDSLDVRALLQDAIPPAYGFGSSFGPSQF